MNGEELTALMSLPLCGLVVTGLILGHQRRKLELQTQLELRNNILGKLSSAEDIAKLLASEGGRDFLQGETGETGKQDPAMQIIKSVKMGLIIFTSGLGGVLATAATNSWNDPPYPISIVVTLLGVGFLAASAISYSLSKKFGILQQK